MDFWVLQVVEKRHFCHVLLEEDASRIIFNISNNDNKGHISNGTHLSTLQEKQLYEQLISQLKEENISLKT